MADDYTPSCWIVGDEDGGHAVWEQRDADAGRENGWTVLPMHSAAELDKAIRQAKAEAWDDGYCAGHVDARAVQPTYPEPTDNPHRIAAGGDHADQ